MYALVWAFSCVLPYGPYFNVQSIQIGDQSHVAVFYYLSLIFLCYAILVQE